jgi:hypothetical protein
MFDWLKRLFGNQKENVSEGLNGPVDSEREGFDPEGRRVVYLVDENEQSPWSGPGGISHGSRQSSGKKLKLKRKLAKQARKRNRRRV